MDSINKNIKARVHPKHYMMHRYWGRKPHNVVSEYILKHTREGEIVLDPFMGSGVVVIEALKINRKAVGVDLNPSSCLIAKNTISNWNRQELIDKFNDIYDKNFDKFIELYSTKCPTCNKVTFLENSIWEIDNLRKIKGTCKDCGLFMKDADDYDFKEFKKAVSLFKKLDKDNKIFYPKNEILKYVKRNGKTHLNMLFTERALVILGSIIIDIHNIKNKTTKNLLLMVFTSMLPNVSKMIPGDLDNVRGKSGWVISKLWSPKIHTEKNIFINFKGRFNKILLGKDELVGLIKPENAKIVNKSSEKLNYIKTESIDYIFTDPPYGDSIAYFGLSMFWNAWLKKDVDYNNEIIYDPCRGKDYNDYGSRIKNVYKEIYRVLKDKKFLSFTFHNRNLNIWKAVMDATKDAGFHLHNIVYQEQAVSSGTQGINKKNTLRGDFVYNFLKDTSKDNKTKNTKTKQDANILIIKNVGKWIKLKKGFLTSDQLYEKLIPLIVENNSYTDSGGKVVNIEKILNTNFEYSKLLLKNKEIYGWQIKK